jgi:hypothetical protein
MSEPGLDRGLMMHIFGPIATSTALAIGDLDLARSYREQRLSHNPGDAMALYWFADCLGKQGETDRARVYAAKCYGLSSPREDTIHRQIALELLKRFPEIGRTF